VEKSEGAHALKAIAMSLAAALITKVQGARLNREYSRFCRFSQQFVRGGEEITSISTAAYYNSWQLVSKVRSQDLLHEEIAECDRGLTSLALRLQEPSSNTQLFFAGPIRGTA